MSSHTFWLCVALALLVQVAARPDAALKSDFFFPKHHGLSVIIRKGPATVAATTSSQNGQFTGNGGTQPEPEPQGIPPPSEVTRPVCTNILGEDGFPAASDPCRQGENVWCCAGVVSNTQLQGPCTQLGPQGTRTACASDGDTPMRYCCPVNRPPL
jgi:hypothetical protein